jgi:hypothetical protein
LLQGAFLGSSGPKFPPWSLLLTSHLQGAIWEQCHTSPPAPQQGVTSRPDQATPEQKHEVPEPYTRSLIPFVFCKLRVHRKVTFHAFYVLCLYIARRQRACRGVSRMCENERHCTRSAGSHVPVEENWPRELQFYRKECAHLSEGRLKLAMFATVCYLHESKLIVHEPL